MRGLLGAWIDSVFSKFCNDYLRDYSKMSATFQSNASTLYSLVTLLVTSGVSLIIAFLLLRKLSIIQRLSVNPPTVFDKTFSVFDPFPKRRRIVGSSNILVLAIGVTNCIFGFLISLAVIEAGAVLGLFTFIVCIGLLMIEEAFEVYKNAASFEKAIKKGKGIASGDVNVFLLLKKMLARLSGYYLFLTILLLTFAATFVFVLTTLISAFSQFVGILFGATSFAGFMGIFIALFLFSLTAVAIGLVCTKVKNRVLDLPASSKTSNLEEYAERMYVFARKFHHHPTLRVPEPEETRQDEKKA